MQTFEGGAAGGVLFLSCWNLIRAIRSFEWKKGGTFAENGNNVSNMLLAIFGVGGGLNGALAFTQARLPAIFERVSLSGSFLRGMAGVGALRFFGYGGAIFDAITQWTKAWGEFQKGNKDAGSHPITSTTHTWKCILRRFGGVVFLCGSACLRY
ncbi:hypothetical protein FHX57_002230 [Paraburkholderia tropica]|uniref:hypothetical protein n=1 Tax=Paraburkholderia tropica TaxID=92647 RepID=UPI00160F5AC3|nr:hypothetical protein [Paraburkholderia tropica]MBB2999888.1 hypothetical protein [Paraburkholderia tropica]MBB6319519.1 hypothetical protein [Paraburkholderia tropica]